VIDGMKALVLAQEITIAEAYDDAMNSALTMIAISAIYPSLSRLVSMSSGNW